MLIAAAASLLLVPQVETRRYALDINFIGAQKGTLTLTRTFDPDAKTVKFESTDKMSDGSEYSSLRSFDESGNLTELEDVKKVGGKVERSWMRLANGEMKWHYENGRGPAQEESGKSSAVFPDPTRWWFVRDTPAEGAEAKLIEKNILITSPRTAKYVGMKTIKIGGVEVQARQVEIKEDSLRIVSYLDGTGMPYAREWYWRKDENPYRTETLLKS